MYTIKLKTNRYIAWCDNCWFETIPSPNYIYTKEEAYAVAKQMKTHYIFYVEIISDNGDIEILDSTLKSKQKEEKKSILKFKVRI